VFVAYFVTYMTSQGHPLVAVTGGVLSFGQNGALSSPVVFSLLLRLTAGYSASWVVCAVPAVLVGVNMLRQGKPV
jgi:hypothetical protein